MEDETNYLVETRILTIKGKEGYYFKVIANDVLIHRLLEVDGEWVEPPRLDDSMYESFGNVNETMIENEQALETWFDNRIFAKIGLTK